MIYEHQDYRSFLQTVFTDRAKERQGYSRRNFADKVGVSQSFLSEVLNRKKDLSMELAFKIAVKMELTDLETQYFCLLVQAENEKDPDFHAELSRRVKNFLPKGQNHDLSLDIFALISDWYHSAILEMTYLPTFQPSAAYLSARLEITQDVATQALDRLFRLGLLIKDENGKVRKAHDSIRATSAIPNGALKRGHRQFLEKAIRSLETQEPSERMSSTDILSLDETYLPEINRLSEEYSRAVIEMSKKSKLRQSVYALTVHFFRLTSQERS